MSNKEKLLRSLYATNLRLDEYTASIPMDIRPVVYDNTYVDELNKLNEMLVEEIFGTYIAEWIYWFLYDTTLPTLVYLADATEICISNIDDFINYLKTYEEFDS